MKCQSLFAAKNKKNIINLLTVEYAIRLVKVNYMKRQNKTALCWTQSEQM